MHRSRRRRSYASRAGHATCSACGTTLQKFIDRRIAIQCRCARRDNSSTGTSTSACRSSRCGLIAFAFARRRDRAGAGPSASANGHRHRSTQQRAQLLRRSFARCGAADSVRSARPLRRQLAKPSGCACMKPRMRSTPAVSQRGVMSTSTKARNGKCSAWRSIRASRPSRRRSKSAAPSRAVALRPCQQDQVIDELGKVILAIVAPSAFTVTACIGGQAAPAVGRQHIRAASQACRV